MSEATIPPRYLSEEAAAKYIGLCPRALRALPIPVCRPNRRTVRYPRSRQLHEACQMAAVYKRRRRRDVRGSLHG
jgi:hypothetical protein